MLDVFPVSIESDMLFTCKCMQFQQHEVVFTPLQFQLSCANCTFYHPTVAAVTKVTSKWQAFNLSINLPSISVNAMVGRHPFSFDHQGKIRVHAFGMQFSWKICDTRDLKLCVCVIRVQVFTLCYSPVRSCEHWQRSFGLLLGNASLKSLCHISPPLHISFHAHIFESVAFWKRGLATIPRHVTLLCTRAASCWRGVATIPLELLHSVGIVLKHSQAISWSRLLSLVCNLHASQP